GPERVGGRGRGAAAPRATPATRGPRQGPGGAMAAGSITTLPTLPEDGGSGAFPPGHFKDPKRLYCKNGGFFLRIHPDGRVDGVREKSDPHSLLVVPSFPELQRLEVCSTFLAKHFPWTGSHRAPGFADGLPSRRQPVASGMSCPEK
ncbi:fibroblast growth factor 2-like, partial [Orycteropus afer afer]|uniref:Fibroblast growth factor 2-like n=1 Tax=Orycteropus afer afer TaxID=1230840 RepID=A0A8B7BBJ5_ORYAF